MTRYATITLHADLIPDPPRFTFRVPDRLEFWRLMEIIECANYIAPGDDAATQRLAGQLVAAMEPYYAAFAWPGMPGEERPHLAEVCSVAEVLYLARRIMNIGGAVHIPHNIDGEDWKA